MIDVHVIHVLLALGSTVRLKKPRDMYMNVGGSGCYWSGESAHHAALRCDASFCCSCPALTIARIARWLAGVVQSDVFLVLVRSEV